VIDLHAHVLPGIDDGPPDLGAALALVRAAAEDGTRTIVATPHVSERYPNEPAAIGAAVAGFRAAVAAAGLPVEVLAGAEIALARIPELDEDELHALTLGGGPNLLVEPPLSHAAGDFDGIVLGLLDRGHGVVLAHPERCPAFQREPQRLTRLVAAGARTSLTASSLVGRFGSHVERFALRLLRDGLVHDLASDGHDLARRRPELATPLREAAALRPGLGELSTWLTNDAPAALLAGTHPGPPPARVQPAGDEPRRGLLAMLRR
jgi:protein-tyrosine phosphatase